MTIVIKSDQLNYLIYKYLLEAGLNHSAFCFYNEAAIEPVVSQFKYNTQAGLLISLLQKGLILTQIQSHFILDDFHECKIPFNLIRPHHCKIVEKANELKEKVQQDYKKQLDQACQRVADIVKVIPNPEPNKPDLDGKERNYLQELYKLRFKCDPQDICFCPTTDTLSVSEKEENKITFMKFDQQMHNFEVTGIIPAYYGNSFRTVVAHSHNSRYIILTFEGNGVTLIETKTHTILKMFNIKNVTSNIKKIHWHPKEQHIVGLEFENEIKIFDLTQVAVISTLNGRLFEWKYADEFIYFNGAQIEHRTISGSILHTFKTPHAIDQLKFSKDKQFILSVCYSSNTARMYTFLNEQSLFIFQQRTSIKSAQFAVSKNATYILILLENGLKIWDVELSQLKDEFSEREVFSGLAVINCNEKGYGVLLADQTLILHDIYSGVKVTRGLYQLDEEEEKVFRMKELDNEQCILVGSNNIYVVNKKIIEPTF